MDHYESIYRSQAGAYQRMIAAEDVDGNLITAIQRVCDPRGKRLLDLGCGTGRLPGLLQSMTSYLVGIDLHRAMLEENAAIRNDSGGGWSLVQGDMRWLPFAAKTFDILTAGWAIGHMRGWFSQNWEGRDRAGVGGDAPRHLPGGSAHHPGDVGHRYSHTCPTDTRTRPVLSLVGRVLALQAH
jgi:SAM-dependent methyltransferase